MAPLHGFVKHATRIHHTEWMKPDYLSMKLTGRDHSKYTIIIHSLLADHLRAYQFEERDVIKGILFGNEDLYINASQHNLRNHTVSKCYGNVSNQHKYIDYRVTEGICTANGVFYRNRNATRALHLDLMDRGSIPKEDACNVNRRNEDILQTLYLDL